MATPHATAGFDEGLRHVLAAAFDKVGMIDLAEIKTWKRC